MKNTQRLAASLKTHLNAATYSNGYNPLIAWTQSIGYRTNPLKYTDRKTYINCAEDFLINSYTSRYDIENHGSLEQYTSDSELMMLSLMENRDFSGFKKIILPESIPLKLNLGECIIKRRSTTTYTGDLISLEHLATTLRAAYGICAQTIVRSNTGNEVPINLRTVPSAGGLYPLSLWVLPLHVHQLPKGIYEYSSVNDALYQIYDADVIDQLIDAYAVSDEVISFSRANYIVLLVGNPWKSMRKYGNKGLRFMLQEIGSVTQNIHLANVALGLGSGDCAAYYEDEMNALLHFDGINQSVLHTVVSGIFE